MKRDAPPPHDAEPPAYRLRRPATATAPVVFSSPHSGSVYPTSFVSDLRVPLIDLRRTEDAFVDELFEDAPSLGGVLIDARYGRAYVDLNRADRELDPDMFADGPPRPFAAGGARVAAGLGCLPKIAAGGEPIYSRRLSAAEGEHRLRVVYDAYHAGLASELGALKSLWGEAVLIDCHSMPSIQPGRRALPDIVLGDRFGSSCEPWLTSLLEGAFRDLGLTVARNAPYAGGYTTRRYGRPKKRVQAIQIEINRALYMDEPRVTRGSEFDTVRALIQEVCARAIDFVADASAGAAAAE